MTDPGATCSSCGERLDPTLAVKIVVHRDDRQHWTVLCPDCALVRCPDCGRSVDVGDVLTHHEERWTSHDVYECERCGEDAPEPDVVEIRHETNRAYRKLVCRDCLQDIPIPPNYKVVREGF